MINPTKLAMAVAFLLGIAAVAWPPPPAYAQQAQPFTPYNGTANTTTNNNGAPQPVQLYGYPNFNRYNGAANTYTAPAYRPACDANNPYYNPANCR